jgi:hypothetical protein
MKADDPRHGTVAGYKAHRAVKESACGRCRAAMAQATRKRRTPYTFAGFDPRDGLTGGRWMWDDRRAIRVWVETGEVA